MLVLTRGVSEGVNIGDNIKIEVLEIENHRVRLGITLDDEIPAYREHTLYINQESFRGKLQLQHD